MLPHVNIFQKPRLLTLTIDRKSFASGEAAYQHVEGEGLIRRLLRLQRFRKGFKVLAFHPQAPEWPHWHVLVDIADPGRWVDLKGIWSLWRDRWGCGGLDLQVRESFDDGVRAARYAISYCQHQAGARSLWLEGRKSLPRAWEVYGALREAMRAELSDTTPDDGQEPEAERSKALSTTDDGPEASEPKERRKSLVAQRLERCGRSATVLLRKPVGRGEYRWTYAGEIPIAASRLAVAKGFGEREAAAVVTVVRELANGRQEQQVLLPLREGESKRQALDRLGSIVARLITKDASEPWTVNGDSAPSASAGEEDCDVPF